MSEPNRPSAPRPNDRPFYIDPLCEICSTALVLSDPLRFPDLPADKVWHDEWVCPNHVEEGIYMDWPQRQMERLRGRMFEADLNPEKMVSFDEVLERAGYTREQLKELDDVEDEGGLKIEIHPLAAAEFEAMIDDLASEDQGD